MKTVVLIACSSQKKDSETRARELYQGTLFKRSLEYAELMNPDEVFILSAKHGLLPLDEEVKPCDTTLNTMHIDERREWAEKVLEELEEHADLDSDRFIYLAGARYREHLMMETVHNEVPLEGLPIGKQVQYLNEKREIAKRCKRLHELFNEAPRHGFPFDEEEIPDNGIYILFEEGERAHGADRIVRIGTHTGDDQLSSRLRQHFIQENKDRSIFRKNIGRALLNDRDDPFLEEWNLDLTTRAAQEKHADSVDFEKQARLEEEVSKIIQNEFSFVVFPVEKKADRLRMESGLVSTVSLCECCAPSTAWFGNHSPKRKIQESGLWQVNELYKEPLSKMDAALLRKAVD